jgi:hypothetical protein
MDIKHNFVRTYSKEDIKNMIEVAYKNKDLLVNTSLDKLLSYLDSDRIEPVKVVNDFNNYFIEHEMFSIFYENGIIKNFLSEISTLEELSQRIINLSMTNWKIIDDKIDGYSFEKMMGDLFELFAELFFKNTYQDNRVSVSNYKPISGVDDFGVDGVGTAFNGKKCTIQVKFRSNPMDLLTIKDLKNFQGISYREYGVDVEDDENLIIFTNCSGVHWVTETNVMKKASRTFGSYGKDSDTNLGTLINGNELFWEGCRKFIDFVLITNQYN